MLINNFNLGNNKSDVLKEKVVNVNDNKSEKILNLEEEWLIQKTKDKAQAEILKYFILNSYVWERSADESDLAMIKELEEELVDILKESKEKWTLDSVIEMTITLSQTSFSDEMRDNLRSELYKLV